MKGDIETVLPQFAKKSEELLLNITRRSIKLTVDESQVPKAKGGRMPVITGFLRSSGVAALNVIPRGPVKGDPKGTYTWDGTALEIVLAKMKAGDTFVWGWTAIYARVQEARHAFLESALMNWQRNVDKAVRMNTKGEK